MKLFTAVSLLLLIQLPPSPQAAIDGVVYRSTASVPVEGAKVTLSRVAVAGNSAVPLTTVSDADGKFAFPNLEPGIYKMSIAGDGFARQDYGSRVIGMPGQSLILAAGQSLKNISVRMVPAGNISGHIRDSTRQAVGQARVELLHATYNASGTRTFQLVQRAATDDRGEYRMYWVTPGRYYLRTLEDPRRRDVGVDFPETYYPGVVDPSTAVAIDIIPESEVNADLTLTLQQLFNVRGRVVDTTTGRAPAQAQFSMVNVKSSISVPFSRSYNPAIGTFELSGVVRGSYVVSAQLPTANSASSSSLATLPSIRGFTKLNVAGADVENVVLNLVPSVTIAGRLQIEGTLQSPTPTSNTNVSVLLTSLDPEGNCGGSTLPDAEGRFTIDGATPGVRCRVSQIFGMVNFYIKDVRFNSLSVLYDTFQAESSGARNLNVVISSNGGQVDGNVTDAQQHTVAQAYVVLIPEQHRDLTTLYKTANSDDKGHFSFRNLPPGDYKVFAFEALERYAYFDPDFSKQYGAKGTLVHVIESSRIALDVKSISEARQ